jgi:hypothetical protein
MIQVVPAQLEPRRAHTTGGHTSDVIFYSKNNHHYLIHRCHLQGWAGKGALLLGSDAGFQDCSFLEDRHEDDRTLLLCAYLKK